jgi:N-acetylglutamate synthase-like GNAT family acetyltransferase
MIRPCTASDVPEIFAIVNDAAQAYKGVIPPDRWHEPYMPLAELEAEIAAGVTFWGCEDDGRLVGIMGMQPVKDVTLIRHAYVRTEMRSRGIGGKLLAHLLGQIEGRILVGTWQAADWAVKFYQKHGFQLVSEAEKDRLLKIYWNIPERQIETSVVLTHRQPAAR